MTSSDRRQIRGERPARRPALVVGLDDTASSAAALRWAAAEARRTGAVLRAVHALSWPYGSGEADDTPSPLDGLPLDAVEEVYRARITRIFDSVEPRPDWYLQFARGDAGPVLVRQARRARALVLGTPSHGIFGRLLVGSVAHYCLAHAACPVICVPVPAEVGAATTAAGAPRGRRLSRV